MTYEEALAFLTAHMRFGIKPGLLRTSALLGELGNPEKEMRYLHIGGTNGKGSVAAMVESALRHSGIRTGLFTSPHLSRYTERIKAAGVEISRSELTALAQKARWAACKLPEWYLDKPTEFEMCTAMCFEHFKDKAVELAVMEVGLGGRYDSTNVIVPDASVITHISYDHMERLGDTLGKIAFDKCGIIKPGIATVSSSQQPEALSMIRREALAKGAPLAEPGKGYDYRPIGTSLEGTEVEYEGKALSGRFRTSLIGVHQQDNLACALGALDALSMAGWRLDERCVSEGLEAAAHPGRFEVIEGDLTIILDGAHNPDGAEALASTLRTVLKNVKPVAVMGFSADKPFKSMLRVLAPYISEVISVKIGHARSGSTDPEEIRIASEAEGIKAFAAKCLEEALEAGAAKASGNRVPLLVCGSLYLVGEARQIIMEGSGNKVGI